jgi:hypothetical protein
VDFLADPADGFPPGTPAGAGRASWHGLLHNAATAAITTDYRWLLLGGALTWGWAAIITAHLLAIHESRGRPVPFQGSGGAGS